jgi:hypothetical protein
LIVSVGDDGKGGRIFPSRPAAVPSSIEGPSTYSPENETLAGQPPAIEMVPLSGKNPSAVGVVDWVSCAVTVVVTAGVTKVLVRAPLYVPVIGGIWYVNIDVEGMAQAPPTME